MVLKIIQGNLFSQEVECFVNPWNLNFISWFLLLPHGVSGQLKKIAGYKPFNEILKKGILKPGQAVLIKGGKIPQKIIHVAGLKWYWMTDLNIVEKCTRNALILAKKENIKSIAFPLIGAGVGGPDETQVLKIMEKFVMKKNGI